MTLFQAGGEDLRHAGGRSTLGFAAGAEVYPLVFPLYISGTSQKTKPARLFSKHLLPVPEHLLDVKELSPSCKSESGVVTTIPRLEQETDLFITFEATEFSPYALVVRVPEPQQLETTTSRQAFRTISTQKERAFIGFAGEDTSLPGRKRECDAER